MSFGYALAILTIGFWLGKMSAKPAQQSCEPSPSTPVTAEPIKEVRHGQ